ncbi:hypothetical protein [Thiobacillus sp.]|uniref:hypothetical protein n=1 Tax=Thiobacillus sp. TaxID=924 RepID=UPI00286DBE92|nr:hypothetical protein [Thiobacillus sp.]
MIKNEIPNYAAAHLGYSDEELQALSKVSVKFESGVVPWATWESENSSFGKTFREWAHYPKIFPLFFSSDHGVHWESRCWPNEINSPYPTFFTWNRKKNDLMRRNHNKNSYHIPHPWINYRKKHFPMLPDNRLGTLVFFPHSNATTTPVYADLDQYINDLKSLPEKYQPVVICLLSDDIEKEIHKKLRKYGVPLVTAGALNSQGFVDRFYSLLYQFKYASSSNIGSHTFYILEAGIPFFLYGPYPEYHIKGSDAVKDGKQDLRDYGDEEDIKNLEKLKELLTPITDTISPEVSSMAMEYLGINSKMSRFNGALIIWMQLVFHLDEVASLVLGRIRKSLART